MEELRGRGLTVEQGGQLFRQGQRAELVLVPLQQTHLLPAERKQKLLHYCLQYGVNECWLLTLED